MPNGVAKHNGAENIGLFLSTCGFCGKKLLAGYMLKYTPGTLSSCLHCDNDMCVRCDKGVLCPDCFDNVPLEVQKSCLRNRNFLKSFYWFFIMLIIIPLLPLLITQIINPVSSETALKSFLIILVIIGAICFLPAFILMKLGYKLWYKNHKHEIEANPMNIDVIPK